ncbi:MAG: glycosyltransferase family 2 protein [Candidatus Falkowbacteria bacterium]
MFSFVIINYNTAELTSACIESIFKYCELGTFEIILIDNNSSASDREILSQCFNNRIKIILNKKNYGFARANNQGASSAQGDYLFFLNSDTIISSNILRPIQTAFENEKSLGVVAPRLLLKDGTEQAYAYGLKKSSSDLSWVSGAALIIRRSIFLSFGGWDENFFMYYEDVDLCRSVIEKGYKIKRLAEVAITHLRGGSPIPYWRRKIFYYKSKFLYIFKHNFKLL